MRNFKKYVLDELRIRYPEMDHLMCYQSPYGINGVIYVLLMNDGRRQEVTQEVHDIIRKPAIDYFLSRF